MRLCVIVSKLDKGHSSSPSASPTLPSPKSPCAPSAQCLGHPLPVVIHGPMIIIPFLQPGGAFCVFVVSLSLLLTTTFKGGETGFTAPTLETAKQGQ